MQVYSISIVKYEVCTFRLHGYGLKVNADNAGVARELARGAASDA